MKNNIIEKLMKETSLEVRITSTIQSYFIINHGGSLLIPIDENGNEPQEIIEINDQCIALAEPLLQMVLQDIKEWKEDDCP